MTDDEVIAADTGLTLMTSEKARGLLMDAQAGDDLPETVYRAPVLDSIRACD